MIKFETPAPTYNVGFGVVCFIAGTAFKELGKRYLLAYLNTCRATGTQPSMLALALAQVVSIASEALPPVQTAPEQIQGTSVTPSTEEQLKELRDAVARIEERLQD